MDRVTLSLIHEENTLPTLTVENMENVNDIPPLLISPLSCPLPI